MREIGEKARRWLGMKAGYVAKHTWLTKHYDKPESCEICGTEVFSRLEWSNISGKYLRERTDYKAVCPPCHRKMDAKNHCKHGHEYTEKNTYLNTRGHRECRTCLSYRRKKRVKVN